MLIRKQGGTRVLTLLNEMSPLDPRDAHLRLPGDVFLLIDGEGTSALNHNEIRERLVRKQAGTRVITLQRSAKASAQTRTTPEEVRLNVNQAEARTDLDEAAIAVSIEDTPCASCFAVEGSAETL